MTSLLLWTESECVSPKLYVEILTPNMLAFGCGAFEKWVGYEAGTLMNETSALIKEILESSLTSSTMRGHSKKMSI